MSAEQRKVAVPFDPWGDLPWAQHKEAKDVVAAHPDGMTLEEIGAVLGLTRERVRQIEATALVKLRKGRRIPVYSGGVLCTLCYICGTPQLDGRCIECTSEGFSVEPAQYPEPSLE